MKAIGALTLFAFMCISCRVDNKYEISEVIVPSEWHSPIAEGLQSEAICDFVWWESLNDSYLNSLLQRASVYNIDLQLSITRILQARSAYQAKEGNLYPHVDASMNYGHVYHGKKSLGNIFDHGCSHIKRNLNLFEVGFDAEWEIDLFGAGTHEIKALKARTEASQEDYYATWVTISAEVAKNYIELRGLQQQLELVQKQIISQENDLKFMQELQSRGLVNNFELRIITDELHKFVSMQTSIEFNIRKAIHRLSILLGYTPTELFKELTCSAPLPIIPYYTPICIPSEMLRRRPDIRKAEQTLTAAAEEVESAIARLFPRLSLRGFIGEISNSLGALFNPANAIWAAGPQLLVPIFNSKLLVQDVAYNKILTKQAIYIYQQTVLVALEETENALAGYHATLARYQQLSESYELHRQDAALMQNLMQRGLKNYHDMLIQTQALFSADNAYVQGYVELLLHYVALYKALGGCWQPERVEASQE